MDMLCILSQMNFCTLDIVVNIITKYICFKKKPTRYWIESCVVVNIFIFVVCVPPHFVVVSFQLLIVATRLFSCAAFCLAYVSAL